MRAGRLTADVAVVGGGPAGIAAAALAAEAGRRVVLLDAGPRPGGQVWRHTNRHTLPGLARRWLERLDRSGADVRCGAQVVDATASLRLGVEHQGRPLVVEAGAVVLATGAQELFLPFPGWTLPGVTGVGGAQALLKAGWEVRGKRVAIAGTGPLLLPVAAALATAGADLRMVAEQAPAAAVRAFGASLWRSPGRLLQGAALRARFASVRYRWGTWVERVDDQGGALRVQWADGRHRWAEPTDLLCTAGGLVPSTELARLLGCGLVGGAVAVDELQQTSVPNAYAAGEPTGNTGMEAALVEGAIAGLVAAGKRGSGAVRKLAVERESHRRFAARVAQAFQPRPELWDRITGDTILCRCEDVPASALSGGWSVREAKLATRAGMGSCQGRMCGPAVQHLLGSPPDTVRAPVVPTALGELADLTASLDSPQGAS
ncbi:MAG TPA: FAD/NAD(P)-binding oxidoreductase [Gemmatimonadales bacterium]|nr:FAD/NAD(P)-binding oxidoreductase [Gemmatimonadales bacterium]